MSSFPMIAPDGSVGDVPAEHVHEAVAAGGKLAADMVSPDGSHGVVPFDQVHAAIAAGGMLKGAAPAKPPIPEDLQPTPTGRDILNAPPEQAAQMAGRKLQDMGQRYADAATVAGIPAGGAGVAKQVAPKVGEAVEKAIPAALSAQKAKAAVDAAGKLFQPIEQAAGDVAIDPIPAHKIADEIRSYSKSGSTLPKVIRNYLNRVESPGDDVTYSEARKFYQNASRLSSEEFSKLTPNIRRMVGNFTEALGNSIREAADSVGMGEQYDQAMNGFRQANQNLKNVEANIERAKKVGGHVASGTAKAAGAGAAYAAYKELSQ